MESKSDLAYESKQTDGDVDVGSGSLDTSKQSPLNRWLSRLSIETGGIQRVTPEERRHNTTHVWNACTFWLSANMAVATVSTGMVGPGLGLNFWNCFTIIVIVNIFACLLPAWTATFGLTGLRMTTFSRYSFGYWGNLLVVMFSMLSTTGWNALNNISGASCLAALSNGALPSWAGVIILAVLVWVICIFGISWIHRYDVFAWMLPLLVWCVASGTGAKHFRGDSPPSPTGDDAVAPVLSYMALIFSFSLAWINCAADYNVRMPAETPRSSIFVASYVGIIVPTILVQSFGAALLSGESVESEWKLAYNTYGVGGPLALALKPAGGFGKFLLVLAALSTIPNNIPNNYSFALHAQNFGPWALRVPRIVFVTFGFIVAVIVGCFASLSFADSLQTVISIVGYWTMIHITIVAEEHIIFRKGRWSAYNLDAWDKPELLSFGWAAIATFCFGFLGAAVGMKNSWYKAPIARLIGSGANVGLEFAFAFTALTFPVFRYLEKRYSHKQQ